ncbi:FAD synthase isoform X1 [Halyomorpha halys]|uniref:FAD synthase isoform X1 n=2 Tax=Halyomorpha halys TaxID=286706 RepID=UPI0006D4C994|nr:FAD synthase-like isoform X1 [Halyomorpha halys]XP_024214592.1 FAD synthase-like isoform X1 [Halyomorpha halys]XP_024214593.1 FAD synthase-like isoform X1 [Halyomorpha halys]
MWKLWRPKIKSVSISFLDSYKFLKEAETNNSWTLPKRFIHSNMDHSVQPPSNVRGNCKMKTAGIIVIGDEILKGQVADQNIAFLAPRLHNLGIKLQKVSIISDSVEEICKEVAEFSSKYDTVITTGGVGPTHDDVTYEGVAAAFGEKVVVSQEIVKFWSYFTQDPEGKNAATIKLTSIPKSAVVLYPDVPKTSVSKGQFPVVTMKNVIIFPGVPKFLQIIFNALEGSYFSSHGVVFYNKTIYLNASEQEITDVLNGAVEKFSPAVQFGSYPKYDNDYYRVLITLESESMVEVNKAHAFLVSQLHENWIANDGDLLGNAYKNTLKLLNSNKLNDFGPILEKSIQTVEKCFDDFKHDEIFISFNGGKDCTALLHLVHSVMLKKYGEKAYPSITGVYFRPQHAFKEIEDFIHLSAIRYNVNLITRDGPIKQSLHALVKEEGSNWKACLMGVRRNDPNCKNLNYMQETDEGWPRLVRVSPILDWTFQDVWTYLKELHVPYCPLYDRGYTSLGNALNTKPNPALEYVDEDGRICYKPAYMLREGGMERRGRMQEQEVTPQ